MAAPSVDLDSLVRAIVGHCEEAPPEAGQPAPHYRRTANDHISTVDALTHGYPLSLGTRAQTRDAHLARLRSMVLVNLIESFERYLKEAAAACVDLVRAYVFDARFNKLSVPTSAIAAHFGTGSLGRALCESLVWTDTTEANARFKALLADPFVEGKFEVFPTGKPGSAGNRRSKTLDVVWQLRHTVVHNVGLITQSDAIKFQARLGGKVSHSGVLAPSHDDVHYLKQLLDETVELADRRIADRVGELLTALYSDDPTLFEPQTEADKAARTLGRPVTVAGAAGSPPL